MRSWQRYAGLFLLIVSGVVIQQSVWVLRLFEQGQPGSGFMPFGLGVILAVLSLCLIATGGGHDERPMPFWSAKAWVHPLLAVIITAIYIVVFDELGAITSVAVLVSGWLLLVERKSVVVAAGTGVLAALVVYLVFARLLQTPFPSGILF